MSNLVISVFMKIICPTILYSYPQKRGFIISQGGINTIPLIATLIHRQLGQNWLLDNAYQPPLLQGTLAQSLHLNVPSS